MKYWEVFWRQDGGFDCYASNELPPQWRLPLLPSVKRPCSGPQWNLIAMFFPFHLVHLNKTISYRDQSLLPLILSQIRRILCWDSSPSPSLSCHTPFTHIPQMVYFTWGCSSKRIPFLIHSLLQPQVCTHFISLAYLSSSLFWFLNLISYILTNAIYNPFNISASEPLSCSSLFLFQAEYPNGSLQSCLYQTQVYRHVGQREQALQKGVLMGFHAEAYTFKCFSHFCKWTRDQMEALGFCFFFCDIGQIVATPQLISNVIA